MKVLVAITMMFAAFGATAAELRQPPQYYVDMKVHEFIAWTIARQCAEFEFDRSNLEKYENWVNGRLAEDGFDAQQLDKQMKPINQNRWQTGVHDFEFVYGVRKGNVESFCAAGRRAQMNEKHVGYLLKATGP